MKGSYFALITLAFAEVFRILALSVPFTGAGVGLMLPLRAAASNLQFGSPRGYALLLLGFVTLALAVTAWLRHSRFGAQLQAVRDNEDAARALGIDPLRTKLGACVLSAAFMGAAGAFYVQVFQYIDPAIAFGPTTSVEALLGAIVGGMGTLWGPVLGALALHVLSDLTRNLFGALPGINMVIYGLVLVRHRDVHAARHRRHRPLGAQPVARRPAWLSRCSRCASCRSPSAGCARCRTCPSACRAARSPR